MDQVFLGTTIKPIYTRVVQGAPFLHKEYARINKRKDLKKKKHLAAPKAATKRHLNPI